MVEITNQVRFDRAKKFLSNAQRVERKSRKQFFALKGLAEMNLIGDLSFGGEELRSVVNKLRKIARG